VDFKGSAEMPPLCQAALAPRFEKKVQPDNEVEKITLNSKINCPTRT
jgi:hypothetical protein